MNTLGDVHQLDIVTTRVGVESFRNVSLLTDYMTHTIQSHVAFLPGTHRGSTVW